MKRIIIYAVGFLAILWVTMFATDSKVLVSEEIRVSVFDNYYDCIDINAEIKLRRYEKEQRGGKITWEDDPPVCDGATIVPSECEELRQRMRAFYREIADRVRAAGGFVSGDETIFLSRMCSTPKWNCVYFNGRSLIEKEFHSSRYDACPNILFLQRMIRKSETNKK